MCIFDETIEIKTRFHFINKLSKIGTLKLKADDDFILKFYLYQKSYTDLFLKVDSISISVTTIQINWQ